MYKYFLCLRYLRKRRIAFFAVGAVCLCVAMVLIVVSVMSGFLKMVEDRSRGMLGDLVAENGSLQGFPFYDEFIEKLYQEMPDQVEAATPVIISYGVIRFPSDQITKPAQIVGIRLGETTRVNDFEKGLFYDKYYPGTTTLKPQQEPCYGVGPGRSFILPPDLERAWQKFLATATEEEKRDIPISEHAPYERPGIYRPIPLSNVEVSTDPSWEGPELAGAILGTDLCAERRSHGGYDRYYPRGSRVQVTFVPISDTGKIEDLTGMPSRLFRYADDCRTGVFEIDSMSVYIDFDIAQQILAMDERPLSEDAGGGSIPRRATQVQIKLKPGVDAGEAQKTAGQIWKNIADRHRDDIRTPELLDRLKVRTWREKQRQFIEAVEKEKYLVTTLFGVVSMVAVLLVGCIFYMIVQQKTRDIGIIKSIGATSGGVAGIFLSYGAAIGVVGGAIGTVVGTLFVWYINEFQAMLGRISERAVVWSPEVYSFDHIPNEVEPQHAVVIYVVAIFASMLGAVVAAWRAARIWPVAALRYE